MLDGHPKLGGFSRYPSPLCAASTSLGHSQLLVNLGECLVGEGRLDEAAECFIESLTIACDLRSEPMMAGGIGALATVSAARGASVLAAFLWGAVEAAENAHGFRIERRDRAERLVEEAIRANPEALEDGRRVALPDAVAHALAWVD